MKCIFYSLFVFFAAVFFTLSPPAFSQEKTPAALYFDGKIAEARASYKRALNRAVTSGQKQEVWQKNMAISWFEEQVGNHRKAIDYSNDALKVALLLEDDFRAGRSLCWLGWSYQSLGLYQLSLEFFEEAKKLGEDESGNIKHVAVWGLATQELGALHFKMGNIETAKKFLHETYRFAEENKIKVGVAEGGRHLAEIALEEGELERARVYADAAFDAAVNGNCSPLNTTRAAVTRGRVILAESKIGRAKLAEAIDSLEDALRRAEKTNNRASIGEAKLLLSRTLPRKDFDDRYELVSDALRLLGNSENELRGTAEAELGRVFAANDQRSLAQFYLKNGFEINQDLFRNVNNAHVLVALARLEKVGAFRRSYLESLEKAATHAEAVGATPIAIAKQWELATALEKDGYYRLALKWARSALVLVETTLEKTSDSKRLVDLEDTRIDLSDLVVALALRVKDSPMPGPGAL